MGLLTSNKNKYELESSISEYFEMPSLDIEINKYDEIKTKINKLDIDIEEKANIINKINALNFTNSPKEIKKIEEEIDKFVKQYNI